MAKRENQRVMLTKRLVCESLIQLLQDRSIYKISIRALCERAGINRSTFYNHYGSQFDVLAEMAQDYLVRIEQMLHAADARDRHSVHQRVTLVFQYIIDNLELSRILLNNIVDTSFSEQLFALPKIEELLDEALAGVDSPQKKRAVVSFAIYGSYKLLQDWINADERLPAQAQTALILALAGKVCSW